jgi:hypothetical protein
MHSDQLGNRTASRGVKVGRILGLGLLLIVLILAIKWVVTPPLKHVSNYARARSLLALIGNAIESYADDNGAYPPDWVPANARLRKLTPPVPAAGLTGAHFTPDPPIQCSAEALYYYLCRPDRKGRPLHQQVWQGSQAKDLNGNGIPEICDPWGRPILYDRLPFPEDKGYDCPDSSGPKHNPNSYDLYIIRPTGMFNSIEVTEPDETTLRRLNSEAMKTYGAGDHDDVIGNW